MSQPSHTPNDIQPLPVALPLNEEGLAFYETKYKRDYNQWTEILEKNIDRITKGDLSLHWMNTDGSHWGKRAKPSSRGLTYTDVNQLPTSGEMVATATWMNFTPRGSIREPYRDQMPEIEDYTVVNRDELWADNVVTLYEEGVARQWSATRDIPWHELEPLPEDLEKASCQLFTFLTEVEFVAGDFPAKWLYRIPQDFLEVKSFLATQVMDEARHQEVFRKRALAGGGLLHASPGFEWALKAILDAPTHTMGTFLLNLLGVEFAEQDQLPLRLLVVGLLIFVGLHDPVHIGLGLHALDASELKLTFPLRIEFTERLRYIVELIVYCF